MKNRGWITAFLAGLFLLVGSANAARPEGVEGQPIALPPVESPVVVELEMDDAPALRSIRDLRVTMTARWVDLNAARATVSVPPEILVVALASTTVDLTLDQATTVTFDLLAVLPGTHFVHVDVEGESSGEALGGYRQAYLQVPETGEGNFFVDHLPVSPYEGYATDVEIDWPPEPPEPPGDEQSFLPLDLAQLNWRPRPPDYAFNEPASNPGEVGILSHSTFVVTGCFFYVSETGSLLAQRWVNVNVFDADGPLDGDDFLWGNTYTGSNGCFTSAPIQRSEPDCCGKGNQDVYVRFSAASPFVVVRTAAGATYSTTTPVQTVGNEDTMNAGSFGPVSGEDFAWRVLQYVNNARDFQKNKAGIPDTEIPGGLNIKIPDPSAGFYGYFPLENTLRLPADGILDKSPDDIGHEYAHYLMDQLYSTFPTEGGDHQFCESTTPDLALAWVEGYADFFGPRADLEIFPTSGATGDDLYNRPWNGAGFSRNMESRACPPSAAGYDKEWNIATAMWDLRDSPIDGHDVSSDTNAFIHFILRDCDSTDYQDFYNDHDSFNGGTCSWWQHGGSRCNFVRTGFQNMIDFNQAAKATVQTQQFFDWVGTIVVSATTEGDPEGCPAGLSMVFRLSHDNSCDVADFNLGTVTTQPFDISASTVGFGDDPDAWTCAQAWDGMEGGNIHRSWSHIGVDNTDPTASVSVPQTAILSYPVSWSASDALSGLTGTLSLQERLVGTSFSTVCTQEVPPGSPSITGSCTRGPLLPGQYCYRLIVSDVAGNLLETDGNQCVILIE